MNKDVEEARKITSKIPYSKVSGWSLMTFDKEELEDRIASALANREKQVREEIAKHFDIQEIKLDFKGLKMVEWLLQDCYEHDEKDELSEKYMMELVWRREQMEAIREPEREGE